jgi:hypothetical protein
MVFPNGNIFIGSWKEGKIDSKGKLIFNSPHCEGGHFFSLIFLFLFIYKLK